MKLAVATVALAAVVLMSATVAAEQPDPQHGWTATSKWVSATATCWTSSKG